MEDRSRIDNLIMLFSTDWFSEYLPTVIPGLSNKTINIIQNTAKTVVRNFMGKTSVYWHIEFSKDRINKTKSSFVEALVSKKPNNSELVYFVDYFEDACATTKEEEKSIWLLWTVNETLIKSDLDSITPRFDIPKFKILQNELFLKLQSRNPFVLEQRALSSDSNWDIYIRGLTPDLPSYLSDFAENYLINLLWLKLIWIEIKNALDDSEIKTLLQWYIAKSQEFVGKDPNVFLPKWMK